MPETVSGVRYAIVAYLISDSLDAETIITIDSNVPLPPVSAQPDVRALMAHLNSTAAFEVLQAEASDWRLMSNEEIRDYKDRRDD